MNLLAVDQQRPDVDHGYERAGGGSPAGPPAHHPAKRHPQQPQAEQHRQHTRYNSNDPRAGANCCNRRIT